MAVYDSQSQSKSTRNSRKFRDLDLDFDRNIVTNDVKVVEDVVAIKRSVRNLVQTNFYERPFHPELGCGVRELLFENFTPLTAVFIKRKIEDVEAIKRSVRNLVNTNFYERPFHPELGCGARQLLFEPFTPVTSIFLRRKIEEVITNYEPRARLDQVIVTESPDRNAIEVRVVFYCMNIANPVTVLTTLQRIR